MAFDSIPQLFNALTNSPPALPSGDVSPGMPGGIEPMNPLVPYSPETLGMVTGVLIIFMVLFIALFIALCIYKSLAFRAIARKAKIREEWTGLAWFPIADLYLLTIISQSPWWTLFIPAVLYIAYIGFMIIPFIGIFFSLISMIGIYAWLTWLFWKVCKVRNKPGWWSLLIVPAIPGAIGLGLSAVMMIIFPAWGWILMLLTIVTLVLISMIMLGYLAWKD